MLHDIHTVQCSSPVFLSITVIDQPDLDPQFIRDFYSASVAEDVALVCLGVLGLGGLEGGEWGALSEGC